MKILYRKPRYPIFFFPKYSRTYPIEYMETARAAIDIIRIKKAESLSATKAKFRNDEPERDSVNVFPDRTENEKTIPKTDATDALRNAAYDESLSFLLNITDNAAPARKKMRSP
jgi:hypothetical protein